MKKTSKILRNQHPKYFSQYRLSGHNGQIFYFGISQQQAQHQFYSGPVHEEQDGKHQNQYPDIPIFLIETYPLLLSDFMNFKQPQPEFVKVKFIVITSVSSESQNPFVIGYSVGADPISNTTSLFVHVPQKYKSNDKKSPFVHEF
ncbi:unnamed protein product [Paramecium sonneborni]|uniref:Uncharacterized protein n=1 Tax=Paramecium sonneborni TaxID=65129 RepID=A0A8S1P3I0_9CILI|nr:unnamed protein product [Paramecium sonneborni]